MYTNGSYKIDEMVLATVNFDSGISYPETSFILG